MAGIGFAADDGRAWKGARMGTIFRYRRCAPREAPPPYRFGLWLHRVLWPLVTLLCAYVAYDVGSDLRVATWQTALGSFVFGAAALLSAVCTYESWAFSDD